MTERGRTADLSPSGEHPGPSGAREDPADRAGAAGTPPGLPAGTDPGRSTGNPVVRVLVVLLALTVVVLGGAGAVDATRQGAQAGDSGKTAWARNRQSQMETIRAQLDAEVPPGSRVYLGNNRSDLWYQRILEFAAMDGIIVVSQRGQADFTLSVKSVPKSVSPAGVRLVATRDR